jgi:hypothetical protein
VKPAKGLVDSPLGSKLGYLTEWIERKKRGHGLYAVFTNSVF